MLATMRCARTRVWPCAGGGGSGGSGVVAAAAATQRVGTGVAMFQVRRRHSSTEQLAAMEQLRGE